MREKRKKETKISPKKKEGKKKRPPVTKPIDSTRVLVPVLSWLLKRKIPSGRRLRRFAPHDRNIDHVHVSPLSFSAY